MAKYENIWNNPCEMSCLFKFPHLWTKNYNLQWSVCMKHSFNIFSYISRYQFIIIIIIIMHFLSNLSISTFSNAIFCVKILLLTCLI